ELQVGLGIALVLAAGVALRILLFGSPVADAVAISLSMAVTVRCSVPGNGVLGRECWAEVSFSVVFGACAPLLLQRMGVPQCSLRATWPRAL
ncbi:unnamed protein product, partial [Effrenium voratum]